MVQLTLAQVIVIFFIIIFSILVLVLPWQWSLAITPLFIFLQRFNIPLPFGRTLQIGFIVLPLLYIKIIISETIKRKSFFKVAKEFLSFKIAPWLITLFAFDLIYTVFSIDHKASIQILFIRLLCYSTAFVMSFWVFRVSKGKPFKLWLYLFILFWLINAVVSLHQWYDCTYSIPNCSVWKTIDTQLERGEGYVGVQSILIDENTVFYRTLGTFLDVNVNAMFFLGTIPVLIYFLMYSTKIKNRLIRVGNILLSASSIALAVPLFMTNISRSALLGFLFVALFFTVYCFRNYWKATLISIILIFFTGILLINIGVKVPRLSRFYTVVKVRLQTTNEADPHIEHLKESLVLAQKTNYLGSGIGSYESLYNRYYPGVDLKRNPHSTFALVLVEQGIPGLVIHSFFIGWFLYMVFKQVVIRSNNIGLISLPFVEYIFACIFYLGFFLPFCWYWAIVPEKSKNKTQG